MKYQEDFFGTKTELADFVKKWFLNCSQENWQ